MPSATGPTRPSKPGSPLRLILVAGALAVLLIRGIAAMNVLSNAALAATNTRVALPTAGPGLIPATYADELVNHMSVRDKIAQMLMIKLIGSVMTTPEAQMIQQQHVGAVLAYGDAITSAPQVRTLITNLQSRATIPLFVATDQEGEQVNRFAPIDGPQPAASSLTTASAAWAFGAKTAGYFTALGFNMDLAPVVDINEPEAPISQGQLYHRTFSSDPQAVATLADAYLQGFQQSGTLEGVIKHFPGLGDASTDPHRGLPIIYKNQAQLDAHEFVPYRILLKDGHVSAIMVTHELLPAIDANYPTTLSANVITGLLRGDLGFKGLIITDSLDMEALAAQYPIDQAAMLAARAGADILMGPSSPEEVASVIDTISAAIDRGQIPMSRIDAAVHRILLQKIIQGLIPMPGPTPLPAPTTTPVSQRPPTGQPQG